MTDHSHLYADFQNVDPEVRIRLNTIGTLEDLARQGGTLARGQSVELYTDDEESERGLTISGTVEFSESESIWVASVDWSHLVRNSQAVGAGLVLPSTYAADSSAPSFV